MKKLFALVLALGLLGGSAVLADDSNRQTELKVTVEAGYTIVIPPTLDIPFGAESTDLAVEVTALHLPANSNALKVAVSQMNPLTNADDKQISYTIDGKAAGAARYFQTLEKQCFAIGITADAWNKAPAGSYSGTVSFSVSFDNLATK